MTFPLKVLVIGSVILLISYEYVSVGTGSLFILGMIVVDTLVSGMRNHQ